MNLYYLGPVGTFSYLAAVKYKTHETIVPCASLYEVIEQLNRNPEDRAIVPIENAIEGTINIVADELIESDVYVIDELFVDVAFDVVAKQRSFHRIVSIAPIIGQVKHYIKEHHLEVSYSESSVDSLNYIDTNTAAVVPHNTILPRDVQVIHEHIEDYPGNKTRFLILSHKAKREDYNYALLCLTPEEDHPGLLANVLNIFNMYRVNLSWIESRPTKREFGNYHFLIQCEVTKKEQLSKILAVLKAMDINVKVIGTFN